MVVSTPYGPVDPFPWEIDLEEVEKPTRINGKCPVCENPISLAVLESGRAVVTDYELAENFKTYISSMSSSMDLRLHSRSWGYSLTKVSAIQCLQCLRILKHTINEGAVEFEVVETLIRTGGNCPVCDNFISLGAFRTGDTMVIEGALRYRKQHIQCDGCFTVLKHSITKAFYEHAKAHEDALLPLDEL